MKWSEYYKEGYNKKMKLRSIVNCLEILMSYSDNWCIESGDAGIISFYCDDIKDVTLEHIEDLKSLGFYLMDQNDLNIYYIYDVESAFVFFALT